MHVRAGTGPNTGPSYATDTTNLHSRSHSSHATSCRTTWKVLLISHGHRSGVRGRGRGARSFVTAAEWVADLPAEVRLSPARRRESAGLTISRERA